MSLAKLLINSEREFSIKDDIVTIGRASDNLIAFANDSNVSRYHAEIEKRGTNEFWIIDLNSSNGTTLNGEKVANEKPLFDGDVLVFGGTSKIKVLLSPPQNDAEQKAEKPDEKPIESKTPEADKPEQIPPPKSSKISLLFVISGLAIGLAIICVFAAAIFYFTRTDKNASGCQAQAKILNPQNGDILKKKAEIEIELENGECVRKVSFLLDGQPFVESEESPFSATLDPAQFPDLAADGLDHKLTVVLEDYDGNKIPQFGEIALALETIRTAKPKETDETGEIPNDSPNDQIPKTDQTEDSQMSLIDAQKMTAKVIPQFAGKFEYMTSNQSFLQEVRKMSAEYASPGYFERAKKYSDVIAKEYIQNRDLDPPLGFILAMSRTKFEPTNQADGAGLWKMNNALVLENAYNGSCGAETIAAPTQNCAAIASSIYLKDIIRDVFDGDIIYGIAAFGMSKNEAAEWKSTLPPPGERKDFWNVIKSPQQREEVVRFFAAALVAENPQKFGLENDRPISELYKSYMQ